MATERIVATLLLLGVLGGIARAQSDRKGQIFLGYAYVHAPLRTPEPAPDAAGVTVNGTTNLNGWNASLAYRISRLMQLVADASGYYGSQAALDVCGLVRGCVVTHDRLRASTYNFLFGPQLEGTVWNLRPFVHVLFGAGHVSESTRAVPFAFSDNSFADAGGGGIDYRIRGRLGLRVQLDLLQDRFFAKTQNGVRLATGLYFQF